MNDPSPGLLIQQAKEMSDELYQACQQLIPQLTSNNPPPTRPELDRLISSSSSILLQAMHPDFGDEIIGLVTLVLYRVPTGVRAYVEDLVVDEKARGRNIGEALMRACIEQASQAGASTVMLTCNPRRLAANRLYQRMGFALRKTNVYSYALKRG